MGCVEKTIENICDWVNEELENTSKKDTESVLPEVIIALAKLVTAQGEFLR